MTKLLNKYKVNKEKKKKENLKDHNPNLLEK